MGEHFVGIFEGGVDPAKAISAMFKLATQDEVDVISLSWGHHDDVAGLRSIIKVASAMGVTIVAASGIPAGRGPACSVGSPRRPLSAIGSAAMASRRIRKPPLR